MATNNNFLIKVTDAKMPQIRKVLQDAGIEVRSIILMHKEEIEDEASPAAGVEGKNKEA